MTEFVEHLQAKLGDMRGALAAGDSVGLAKLAHWLKGVGGTAGFPMLADPAKSLEQMAKDGRLADAQLQIDQIAALAGRIEVPQFA